MNIQEVTDTVLIIKQTTLSGSLIIILWYLWIDQTVFLLYTFLIFIDFVTWIIKWYIHKELSSGKASNWFLKKFIILLLVLAIAICSKIIWVDPHNILSWALTWLAIAELYSIIWNTYQIRTWKRIKEYDATNILLTKFMNIIEDFINKFDKKNKM